MSLFDLLFLVMVVVTACLLLVAIAATLRKNWRSVRRALAWLASGWLLYFGASAAFVVMTPQRLVPIGSDRCFDEMCFAVTGFRRVSHVGPLLPTRGVFYLVDVRISSRARGRTQHERGRDATLMEQSGRRYPVSLNGMQALAAAEGATASLETDLDPGDTRLARLVFDVPIDVDRPAFTLGSSLLFYPPRIILGDEMNLLHRPTVTVLQ